MTGLYDRVINADVMMTIICVGLLISTITRVMPVVVRHSLFKYIKLNRGLFFRGQLLNFLSGKKIPCLVRLKAKSLTQLLH